MANYFSNIKKKDFSAHDVKYSNKFDIILPVCYYLCTDIQTQSATFLIIIINTMGFLKDFKAFAMKGNVIDMAVGVIIGGAFGKIVTSLVNDIIMPLIGTVMGGIDFKTASCVLKEAVMEGETVVSPEVLMTYGNFIQTVVDFLIIALSIFVTIRVITKLTERRKKEEAAAAAAPAPAPEPSAEEKLLTEIRDLLKEKK